MASVTYEHPLNQKVRAYLRLEHFLTQIDAALINVDANGYYPFFHGLFDCLDVIEKSDIKTEMSKELDALQQNLTQWSQYPNVDKAALGQALDAVTSINTHMPTAYQQLQHIKDDPFLMSLRQRFTITGGNCRHDLPNLHFWCQQAVDVRERTIQQWLLPIRHYQYALQSVLKFLREKGKFQSIAAESGMYADAAEGLEMLRIKLPQEAQYYPSVSGNRFRFAIRFQGLQQDQGHGFIEQTVNFQLARC